MSDKYIKGIYEELKLIRKAMEKQNNTTVVNCTFDSTLTKDQILKVYERIKEVDRTRASF